MEDTPRIAISQVVAEQEILPFPTKAGGSEQRPLTGKKVDELKEMCRDYGLFISGTKPVLLDRLRIFSTKFCNDPASCNLSLVKRRTHKGPRDGPKKSQPKQSANRRAAIIDTERVTERSKDTRTADEMKDLLIWADRTVARLAYKPPEPKILPMPSVSQASSQPDRSLHDRMQVIEDQLAAITTSGASAFTQCSSVSSAAFTPAEYIVYDRTTESLQNFSNYDMNLSFNMPGAVTWSPTSDHGNLHIGQTFASGSIFPTCPSVPPPAVNSTTPAPASCIPNAPPSITSKAGRSVQLGDGTVITINDVSRIAVPATSFAENIERLNQMWDDTSLYWKNDSMVTIDNHSIALVYWPNVFKKTGLWSAHKSNWTEWKFLVERYRQGTPDEFWNTFRLDDGSKMSYTAICTTLRNERKSADEDLVVRARQEYGEEFEVKFSYRCSKTNARVVMTKASSIAKEYKRLKGR
ncbi:hypothetical protein K438DRAFT_1733526 [Mycena galopus ATCC 62051]|nr:hypothetical protein K438DRAFT_1733526 [Mycena galopus ATCC 62051]